MLGTLHEAFDGYIEHVKTTGNKLEDGTLRSSQRKRLDYVESLKVRHKDRPLHELTFDVLAEMFGYWTNRPQKTRGEGRYKRTSARHRLKELERFLGWLDSTSSFGWEMPKGVERISRRFTDLESDYEKSQIITKPTYTPEQLGVISQHADEFDYLLLLVCVNCAYGAAEVGRLTMDEVLFDHAHEFASRLNFETTSADSFIRLNRPKSSMFGEWIRHRTLRARPPASLTWRHSHRGTMCLQTRRTRSSRRPSTSRMNSSTCIWDGQYTLGFLRSVSSASPVWVDDDAGRCPRSDSGSERRRVAAVHAIKLAVR